MIPEEVIKGKLFWSYQAALMWRSPFGYSKMKGIPLLSISDYIITILPWQQLVKSVLSVPYISLNRSHTKSPNEISGGCMADPGPA